MAVFRPTTENEVCTLNFDDKFTYEIPLDEETNLAIVKVAEDAIVKLNKINDNTSDAYGEAYNSTLDAIDEILGENAGADIMSIFKKPGLIQACEVINFITTEYTEAYRKMLDKFKTTATMPPVSHPAQKRGRK